MDQTIVSNQESRVITPTQHLLRSVALCAILLISRLWVLRHPIPVHGDEAGFVAALGFPSPYPVHLPGYPLWIALGTMAWKLGASKYAAFVFWSLLGSLAAPWLLYRGLRWVLSEGLAWWTALAFGLNPLMWFLSVTALNYTVGVTLGLIVIGCVWRGKVTCESRWIERAAWGMAVCVWLRPDYLYWLGPMVLYGVWTCRRKSVVRVLSIVLLSYGSLIATILYLYGGVNSTVQPIGNGHLWVEGLLNTSVFRLGVMDGVVRSAAKLLGIGVWVFGASGLLLVISFCLVGRIGTSRPSVVVFLLWWTLPLTAFVLLIHMTEPGHVILLIPAVYVLMAAALTAIVKSDFAVRIMSGVVLCSIVQFVGWPWSVDAVGWQRTLNAKIAYLSAEGLRQIDHRWDIHTPSDLWPTPMHRPTSSRPSFSPHETP